MNTFRFALLILIFYSCTHLQEKKKDDPISTKERPYEYFSLQRAYPDDRIDWKTYLNALEEAKAEDALKNTPAGFDRSWDLKGPGNIGGRINTIALHPTNENILYVGFSAGGAFKTVDGGQTWIPIFDDFPYLAIGDIALDPNDPSIVYLGTGDPNISINPFIGNGLYKSTDGGASWTHLGLSSQRIISKIIVDPTNPDIVYVATMGTPFERNTDRGLYKTIDGGENWEQMLFISNQAGVIDMVMDPENSEILYAAGWDRIRTNSESIIDGPGAKIFKTSNGGQDWVVLTNDLPGESIGRIGLAISATNRRKLYAMYVGLDRQLSNIYETDNEGASWEPIDISTDNGLSGEALGGFGWYFGKIRVHPENDEDLYLLGVELWRRNGKNANWESITPNWWENEVHADKHDLAFNAAGEFVLATDGGLYKSQDQGESWEDMERIAATQFYHVSYNPHMPNVYFGGAQDNGTTGGSNIESDWPRIYGGDGFDMAFHPTNPYVYYAEAQGGRIVVTENGGSDWVIATQGIDSDDRRNWDMPYLLSKHNPDILYAGTYRMYKSTRGVFPDWEPISGDLTDGIILHPRFHSISALDESPLNPDLLFVGTTDGNCWKTVDGGMNWQSITQLNLPNRYITDIKASPTFSSQVYVSFSGYKDNEFIPRIFRSENLGEEWVDISGDLPELAINEMLILPGHQDSILFVATDGGIYGTVDAGQTWSRLGANLPMITVFDLVWNEERNELVAGTFARSIWTYPLDSIGITPVVPEDSITTTTQVVQWNTDAQLRLYPSPTIDDINIELEFKGSQLSFELIIFDQSGKQFFRRQGGGIEHLMIPVDVRDYPAGMYYVKILSGGKILTNTFVKIDQ